MSPQINSPKKRCCNLFWLLLIAWCACNLYQSAAFAADIANKQEILKKARQAYYSMENRGFPGFEADLVPNWRLILKDQIATNPSGAEAGLKKLGRLRFGLSFSSKGKTTVTHQTDLVPENATDAAAFDQIYSGMEQAMTGFFETWSLFMLYSPFPAVNSEYQLEEIPDGYRLSYMEGPSSVITSMSKDFSIISISVIATNFASVINPSFTKTAQGYVLTDYEGIYKGFENARDVTNLKVHIDYQDVGGFKLPGKLNMGGTQAGNPIGMEVLFSNHHVSAR